MKRDDVIELTAELGETLHAREWGDEAVIYDDLTGDTHLLDRHSMLVLRGLRDGPRPVDAFVAANIIPDQAQSSVEEVVAGLVEIGVVCRRSEAAP